MLVGALLIFLAISAVSRTVGLALYQGFVGAPPLARDPAILYLSAGAVSLVTVLGFVPFPWGYLLSLAIRWRTARSFAGLSAPRGVALFLILGALSFVSRLAVLGARELF